jgi:hypothetical protein
MGEDDGEVVLQAPDDASTGGTQVIPGGSAVDASRAFEIAPVRRLDDYGLTDVDLLKLDCEGYEVFALRGGLDTIARCLPVIVCEQKKETGGMQAHGVTLDDVTALLFPLGYRVRHIMQGDYFLTAD